MCSSDLPPQEYLAHHGVPGGVGSARPRCDGRLSLARSLEQVRVSSMQGCVGRQRGGSQHRLQYRQSGLRTVRHANRDRAVDLDHRGWSATGQLAVEGGDLRPVGVAETRRLRMQRGDRGLELIGTRLAVRHRDLQHPDPFGDERVIPARPVLIGQ